MRIASRIGWALGLLLSVVASGATAASDPVFPLQVVAGKRYLLDAAGQPFLLRGDAAWSIVVQLTPTQAEQYLDDRRGRGFNAILVNLLEHKFAARAPSDLAGNPPFNAPGDFTTPNETYFNNAAHVIGMALQRHMLVLLAPAYLGYHGADEGWYQEMKRNGVSKLFTYGQYVARRFAAFPNILWVEGGDYDVPERELVDAVARGVRSVSPNALQTFHGGRGTAALDFIPSATDWLNVNVIYTDDRTVVAAAHKQYNTSTLPFFLIEDYYEGAQTDSRGSRAQAYQAMLAGASGQVMGNLPIWDFCSPAMPCAQGGWQAALGSEASITNGYLQSLLASRDWTQLRPDTNHSFLTGGARSGADEAVAAVAADGSFALVYVPSARTVKVKVDRLQGPLVAARWYDPTSATQSSATTPIFTRMGSLEFASPKRNSRGASDWVLVLEHAP